MARGTVTNVYTDGYLEVDVWVDGRRSGAKEVAESNYKKPRRGDIVDMAPAKPYETKYARLAYIGPVVFFLLGILMGRKYDTAEQFLLAGILFLLTFIMAWLMNRPARLRRRLSWRVTHLVKKADPMEPYK